jgi:hypothetical protein
LPNAGGNIEFKNIRKEYSISLKIGKINGSLFKL